MGVELAGALKNVYALAAGAVEGAGLGASARSALIARAFAELTPAGRSHGRAGGDADGAGGARRSDAVLHVAAIAQLSRGHGARTWPAAGSRSCWPRGSSTAPVAQQLARTAGIDAPLIDAVNLLLGGNVQY